MGEPDSRRRRGGAWFRLTLALGHSSVAAGQRAVSSREFTEWLAYARLEPFGPAADDARMAQLMALIANVNRDPKRRTTPWTPDDFLVRRGPRPPTDQDSLRPRIDAAMAAFGGIRKR